jgi:hypothetical protein
VVTIADANQAVARAYNMRAYNNPGSVFQWLFDIHGLTEPIIAGKVYQLEIIMSRSSLYNDGAMQLHDIWIIY